MKRISGYVLLGLTAFLLFLLLQAPATLLTDRIGTHLAGFSVQGTEGSVIEGAMQGVRWRGVRIERIAWRWLPLALFVGRLEFSLKTTDPEIKLTGHAAIGLNQLTRLRDLTSRLPLSRLGSLVGAVNLPFDGITELDLHELDLNAAGRPLAALGTVRMLNLRVNLGQPLNLGDYEIRFDSQDAKEIQGKIKDNNAPLAVEGTLNLSPDGRYRLAGHAALRDPGNRALQQAMSLLGPPGGDGRWPLNFSGILAP